MNPTLTRGLARVTHDHSWSSMLAILLFAATPAAAQTSNPEFIPTITAQSAGGPAAFPNATGTGFENTVDVPANGAWTDGEWADGGWDFDASAGIMHKGYTGIGQPQPPAEGDYHGYLYNAGSIETTDYLQPGTWRVSFQAAQADVQYVQGPQTVQVSVVDSTNAVVSTLLRATPGGTTFTTYTSRPFRVDAAGQLRLRIHGLDSATWALAFLDAVEVQPIAEWSDPATWGGTTPTFANRVLIPEGVAVALDSFSPQCRAVTTTVHGELLALDRDTRLRTRAVLVSGPDALFEVGTRAAPMESVFELRLYGDDPWEDFAGAGSKFLVAEDGGQIDMHGREKLSWTRLTSTAMAGATTIQVEIPVGATDLQGWGIGDQVVIAGTTHRIPGFDGPSSTLDFAEKVQLDGVSGGTLTLADPLAYEHNGALPQTFTDPDDPALGWTLEQRAEVGMLSHNVRIVGVMQSYDTFGGHVMMRRIETSVESGVLGPGGRGRFSHVELRDMGQNVQEAGVGLGRYPIHWHMQVDDGQGQYLVGSSIHNSFNRAVTIHGTRHVQVDDNVAYKHVGHGVFLEDGSEQFNQITHNLVLSTLKPAAGEEIIPSDNSHDSFQNRSPASFWITNPNNTIDGNVAAGTVGTGFWFIFPEAPLGLSSNPDEPYAAYIGQLSPQTETLGSFDGNLCHSCESGFDMNDSIVETEDGPSIDQNVGWYPTTPAVLKNYTVYACGEGLYTGEGEGDITFEGCVLADNNYSVDFAGFQTVADTLIVADSSNNTWQPTSGTRNAFAMYHVGKLENCHLVGFDTAPCSVLFNREGFQKQTNYSFDRVTFDPPGNIRLDLPSFLDTAADPRPNPREWTISIREPNGTMLPTGSQWKTLIGNHPMMTTGLEASLGITVAWESAMFGDDETLLASPFRFGHVRIRRLNAVGNPAPLRPIMNITRLDYLTGTPTASYRYDDGVDAIGTALDTMIQIPVIVDSPATGDEGYYYAFEWEGLPTEEDPGAPIGHLLNGETVEVIVDGMVSEPGAPDACVLVFTNLDGTAPVLYLDDSSVPMPSVGSIGALYAQSSTSYHWDSTSGFLFLRFRGVPTDGEQSINMTW